jgi:hypothetical protein
MKIGYKQLVGMKDIDINDKRVVYTDHNGVRMYRKLHDGNTLGIPFLYLGDDAIENESDKDESEFCVECGIKMNTSWGFRNTYFCYVHGV